MLETLALVIAAGLIGGVLGSFTGIVPGIHANTLALILLSLAVVAENGLDPFVAEYIDTRLLLVVIIASTSLAHTFANFIPSTYLGAPEGDTAISMLPMHDMFFQGKGYRAIALSLIGSVYAVIFGLILFIPIRYFVIETSWYSFMVDNMFYVVLAISTYLILVDRGEVLYRYNSECGRYLIEGRWSDLIGSGKAALVFAVSGFFGYIVLGQVEGHTISPIGLPSTSLFPALTGIFGVATLGYSAYTYSINEQSKPKIIKDKSKKVKPHEDVRPITSSLIGSIAGAGVGILPGVTPGIGTIVAMWVTKTKEFFRLTFRIWGDYTEVDQAQKEQEEVIITLGAVNTAASVAIIGFLFVALRPRNGTSIVINELITVSKWSATIPLELIYILIGLLISTAVAYFISLQTAWYLDSLINKVNYVKLVYSIIIGLFMLVILFTGIMGLMVFVVAILIGILPILLDVRRSISMGFLLVPVMFYFGPFV